MCHWKRSLMKYLPIGCRNENFQIADSQTSAPPPWNWSLMAIESWKMYKIPLKSDNPPLTWFFSWRNHNLWKKMPKIVKIVNFHGFWPTSPPENGSLMVIHHLTWFFSWRNHNLWEKCNKITKIVNFHCFWPMLSPENWCLMDIESQKMYKMPFKLDYLSLNTTLSWQIIIYG